MTHRDRLLNSLGAALLISFAIVGFRASSALSSAPAADVVEVDLDPLIDSAVKDRNRFAVDIPHPIDSSQAAQVRWSITRGLATWHYAVRVPTAVSLSFHAANIFLPSSAQLKVIGGGSTYLYSARDINKHQLWSRVAKGDSLSIELTVAPKERRYVVLQIASVQAGYRGFGHAVADHPYYSAAPTGAGRLDLELHRELRMRRHCGQHGTWASYSCDYRRQCLPMLRNAYQRRAARRQTLRSYGAALRERQTRRRVSRRSSGRGRLLGRDLPLRVGARDTL